MATPEKCSPVSGHEPLSAAIGSGTDGWIADFQNTPSKIAPTKATTAQTNATFIFEAMSTSASLMVTVS
jgi:hypothetical protein